jgi:hypothetical protein
LQPNLFEAERYCYYAVASNREGGAAEVIWEHQGRGNSENWHKELKVGVGMEQMPCGQFQANALYFAIGVLAYNLAQLLRCRVLPEWYCTATPATLRWKVYRLAGKLVRHARGLILQIKADTEKWLLLHWCAQLAGTGTTAPPPLCRERITSSPGWAASHRAPARRDRRMLQ